MTAIRIKDGDHRITTQATAITIECPDGDTEYRIIAWQENVGIHIGNIRAGAAIKIMEGNQ